MLRSACKETSAQGEFKFRVEVSDCAESAFRAVLLWAYTGSLGEGRYVAGGALDEEHERHLELLRFGNKCRLLRLKVGMRARYLSRNWVLPGCCSKMAYGAFAA